MLQIITNISGIDIRQFVVNHPDYKKDSVVSEQVGIYHHLRVLRLIVL